MTDQQVIARAKFQALQIAFREAVRSIPAEEILTVLATELREESIRYTGTRGSKMRALATRLTQATAQ